MEKVAFNEWRKAKNAEPGICVSFIAVMIIQVSDSIAWVRCAYGNVYVYWSNQLIIENQVGA